MLIMIYAFEPPDTLIVSPVIADAPSDAKKTTVSAISEGSNKRFIGDLLVMCFPLLLVQKYHLVLLILQVDFRLILYELDQVIQHLQ